MGCWKCDIPVGEKRHLNIVADMFCKCGHEWEAAINETLVHRKNPPGSHQFARPDLKIFLWCPSCGAGFSFVTLPCGADYAFDLASIPTHSSVESR